ncbi:endonuclease/exonuclease/phosphatase family protein [Myroides sp. JBRI-B21084]|uniref:endonuclease/exonuclease/phosphatase family protein n=1 Tax=Myroides sp. JBRI-B21084 TaxID=3119977 RepID=UPI0026E21559|nr:endonuclease/exonuclease/phosphatase family protein [Paenimyroides cloacae]WKW45373.1 endonuclease/exonuclease/phosphatase family protein [Paenimyroides cloacae]
MKQLKWFNKIAFILNILLVILTLLGFLLPYMAPKLFPFLSVLTLILPTLLMLNLVCVLYWTVQFKKQVLLSVVVFLIGYTFFTKFYKFSATNDEVVESDFTVLSYNVRLFNLFNWLPNENVPENIKRFIEEHNPDIICFQEYSKSADYQLDDYKFRHITMHGKKIKTGQAIFSKFRIIDEGEIALPNSDNNVVYADVVKNKDTIRVYSIHLQSVNISPDINEINESKSKRIFNRLSEAFKVQQLQSELIQAHMEDFKGHKLICGDMNNTAFSYVYKNIIGDMNDAFVEAGKGFGQTYNYKYYPARIDYILVDDVFEVKEFKTFNNFKNSDHFPIMARLNMKNKKTDN